MKRVAGAKFLGVWVDENLKWTSHIEKVRGKIGRLVGILGRTSSVLGGQQLLMLYNALVLPHLQYCLMVWGDFREGGNKLLGDSLLRHQKTLARFIIGKKRCHADPIMGQHGILKIHELYRQQLRTHAWRFKNGCLPDNQAKLLSRVEDVHSHNTRAARTGVYISSRDHRVVGFRVPKEWDTLPQELKLTKSFTAFKKKSKEGFLREYREFSCSTQDCYVCGGGRSEENSNAAH